MDVVQFLEREQTMLWRSPACRLCTIMELEDTLQRCGTLTTMSSPEIENYMFQRATSQANKLTFNNSNTESGVLSLKAASYPPQHQTELEHIHRLNIWSYLQDLFFISENFLKRKDAGWLALMEEQHKQYWIP
ncbi:uncharacterized protein LOC124796440 isoform X1 [Schistocerca piceifrons]|uniref:uncharacterized protein LOC124796440 isoform X1 n=1 Tax=Schistocerca piceifrons TaxID=274613 RepID=UPI001F5F8159|nr:uncharacterized protein LOC124796440 isoform X1 [Schistocerca piceifrons]